MASGAAYLIVNADDYGYFRCVSRGILKAADAGIVTATGVLANAPQLAEAAAGLRERPTLDVGVHLNLTEGSPLTPELARRLGRSGGRFPGTFRMAGAVLSGMVELEDVRREWRAQIERCLANGLRIRFLNSHEHLHALPSLFAVASALASEYAIPHVRLPAPEFGGRSAGALLRNAVIGLLRPINGRRARLPSARFLGLDASGRVDLAYLERTLPRLAAGEVYELMCHPGERDLGEISDSRLLRYHDWEGELRTLTSPGARELLRACGIKLIGYRHLDIGNDRFVVRAEEALAAAEL